MIKVLSVGNSKEPMIVHLLHLSSTDVDRGVCLFPVEMNLRECLLSCLSPRITLLINFDCSHSVIFCLTWQQFSVLSCGNSRYTT